MANYTVTGSGVTPNSISTTSPGQQVGVVGTFNGIGVWVVTYKSALDQAYNSAGSLGITNYLSPLMQAASSFFYWQENIGHTPTAPAISANAVPYVSPGSTSIPASWVL